MHRHAMTCGEQHLKVVVLVADRHGLRERDVQPLREPRQGRALIDAWGGELKVFRVADGDIKIATKRFACLRQHRLWVTSGRVRNNF